MPEIVELVRAWFEETYPGHKFSIRRGNYHSVHTRLVKTDFEAFTRGSGKVQGDASHHHIRSDKSLTDRTGEVVVNIYNFIVPYNSDNSDPMTGYLHANFYLTLGIGSYKQPHKVEPLRLNSKDKPEVFRHLEGPTHETMC